MTTITIQLVNWHEYREDLQSLRARVFIQEQNVDPKLEYDGLDELQSTSHLAALQGEEVIGCCRLLADGKITRLAISPVCRGQGVGARLLKATTLHALKHQKLNSHGRAYMHAQTQAKTFHEKMGFRARGETFEEAGIEHVLMEFEPHNIDSISTLFTDKVWRFEGIEDIHFHLAQMTQISSRYINIFSDHLNPAIYANTRFIDALSSMARKSRNSLIRVLLKDSKELQGLRHPLIALSQRISTKFQIRRLTEKPQNPDSAYLLSDSKRLLYFNNENEQAGFANYQAPAEALHQMDEFENLWEKQSRSDPELMHLNI